MLDNIVLTINNKEYEYSNGITLEEISKDFSKDFKYPILLAKVNNRIKELDKVITDDCEIKFLDLTSREGNRTHISGLTFLLVYTVKKLFGDEANIIVEHSIDKGIYITTNFKLTESKVNSIKEEMNKLISADMPITKVTVDRLEAINYFEEIKDYSKSGVLKYNTNTFINLYRMGNLYNYFYNFMPISTKYLKAFDLTYIKDNGFVLRFPTPFIKNKIKNTLIIKNYLILIKKIVIGQIK